MQNSLERLFEGLATTLREEVLPAVEDPYGRAQLLAAVELLGNLAARVEWRCADLRDEVERIREVLAAAPSPPAILSEPVPTDNASLLASRDAHLRALASVEVPDRLLRSFVTWELGRELGLLRTGMYR